MKLKLFSSPAEQNN